MDETVTEIGKLIRTVTKLLKEKTEDYFNSTSPLEKALREISDESNCSVPNSLLQEIAKATNEIQHYHPIMQTIWTSLDCEASQWRRIYKALSLLEYIILLGPPRALADSKLALPRINIVGRMQHIENSREQCGGVRQKADAVVKLLNDTGTLIGKRRHQINVDSARYHGIENKPTFEFRTTRGSPMFNLQKSPSPSSWGDLGGAFRNPFEQTNDKVQTNATLHEDAGNQWGIGKEPEWSPYVGSCGDPDLNRIWGRSSNEKTDNQFCTSANWAQEEDCPVYEGQDPVPKISDATSRQSYDPVPSRSGAANPVEVYDPPKSYNVLKSYSPPTSYDPHESLASRAQRNADHPWNTYDPTKKYDPVPSRSSGFKQDPSRASNSSRISVPESENKMGRRDDPLDFQTDGSWCGRVEPAINVEPGDCKSTKAK